MQVRQDTKSPDDEVTPTEIVLDAGGWISGPALDVPHRQLALDLRSHRVGVIMCAPDEWYKGARGRFWLRPVNGGLEWDAPKQFVKLISAETTPEES